VGRRARHRSVSPRHPRGVLAERATSRRVGPRLPPRAWRWPSGRDYAFPAATWINDRIRITTGKNRITPNIALVMAQCSGPCQEPQSSVLAPCVRRHSGALDDCSVLCWSLTTIRLVRHRGGTWRCLSAIRAPIACGAHRHGLGCRCFSRLRRSRWSGKFDAGPVRSGGPELAPAPKRAL